MCRVFLASQWSLWFWESACVGGKKHELCTFASDYSDASLSLAQCPTESFAPAVAQLQRLISGEPILTSFFTTLELSGWLRRLFGKHSEKLSSFSAAWEKKKEFSILHSFISPSDGAALIYLGRLTNRPPLRRCHRHRRQLLTMRLFVPHLWAVGLRGAGASWPKWGRVPLLGWRKAINSISMGSLWK